MWTAKTVKEIIKIKNFYSLFTVHFKDGFNFYGESHNFWECLYVLDGAVCVSADERVYNLSSGEIIFHKPLEMHKFYIDHPKGADVLVFSFDMTGSKTDYFKEKVFGLFPYQKEILLSLFEYLDKKMKTDKIPAKMCDYLSSISENDAGMQTVSTYIIQLFLSLTENEHISRITNDPHSRIFKEAVNYMKSRIGESPGVDEIARNCGVSTSGLKRIFYKYSGISIHKYFLTLKINTAANMLKNGDTVSEVAESLSFSSQGYFSKVFKRETGLNPSQIK